METNAQMKTKITLPANKAKWHKVRECISKKRNQFEEHCVAGKTEAYEMHYEDSGAPNVLHRRVQRVKLLPRLEGLVRYSMLLKDQDIKEVKRYSAFVGCQLREVGKAIAPLTQEG
jgi:hypothetical protein